MPVLKNYIEFTLETNTQTLRLHWTKHLNFKSESISKFLFKFYKKKKHVQEYFTRINM